MNTWQPIETAPRDGTRVDLWGLTVDGGFRLADAWWAADPEGGEYSGWTVVDEGSDYRAVWLYNDIAITHWMPIRTAPPVAKRLRRPQRIAGVREGLILAPSVAARDRYGEELRALIRRMSRVVDREVRALFESPAAEESQALDASLGSQARIALNDLSRRFDTLFRRQSARLAERMVARVDRDSRGKFGRSLRELSGDTTLPARVLSAPGLDDVLKASTAENVALIRSISSRYLLDVQGAVMRAIQTGRGMADLMPALQRYEGISMRRADIIARDQVSKATAAVNRTRAQAAGIKQFRWVHSGGGRDPRPLHVSYHGEVFSYDDPPVIDERTGETGLPGEAINCRCTLVPVLDFDSL